MPMTKIERLTPAGLADLKREASEFLAYAIGPVTTAVKTRYMWYHELAPLAEYAGYSPAEILGADLYQANLAADESAKQLAEIVAGLKSKRFMFVKAIDYDDETQRMPAMALIDRETAKNEGLLGFPALVPFIIGLSKAAAWIAVATGAGYGALWLFNAWNLPRALEAEAKLINAQNQQKALAYFSRPDVPAADKAVVADHLRKAQQKIGTTSNQGFLDKLTEGIGATGLGITIGLLIAMFMLGAKRR